ncbi:MAG TPA: tRNA epoxyqueuosine(34) reductase QueG [Acidobacteriaceae bacterium]|nr:tRNA epoxyqueuosine(34) reductase QueG [Acidobacteriaceae bacterium]
MSTQTLQQIVQQCARGAGFHLSGIAPAGPTDSSTDTVLGGGESLQPQIEQTFPELAYFGQWVAEGRAGEMEYLKRRDPEGRLLRSSVQAPFPWARSVIVCAVNYNSDQPYSIEPKSKQTMENSGWIARYAWSGRPQNTAAEQGTAIADPAGKSIHSVVDADQGQRSDPTQNSAGGTLPQLAPTDYHSVMRTRLQSLCAALKSEVGEFESRCFVDTGPLVERVYAKYAGLGWQGKNTCLIHESLGSWFFLGVILTSLELRRGEWVQPMPDRCGSCSRCIDACPTEALVPYRMDASRCIAYLTIEKRGAIPEDLAAKVGRNVFGCDICQEVCPWNRRAPVTDWPELQPRPELVNPALDWLAGLNNNEYRQIFRGSPVERAKYSGLQRNVEIAQINANRATGADPAGIHQDISATEILLRPEDRPPN